jgi:Rab proteins geranylgeranyltransferase component A
MLMMVENVPEPFLNAIITKPAVEDNAVGDHGKLSFSRAYTLSLSPQIIYSRSKLLSQLVSSKVYRQLEFQAVGNWWIYDSSSGTSAINSGVTGDLKRIPNGREDVFVDNSIEIREKRNLMKFLKFVVDFENRTDIWQSWAEEPLPAFLANVFQLSSFLQAAIMALTLSLNPPSVRYSLPRISRHLTSMGVFGPGFAAVIPRWGGSSEIVQVACRAGAVGGGVYMLGTGVKLDSTLDPPAGVTLTNNEVVRTKALVTPRKFYSHALPQSEYAVSKMIAIVSSDLASLFTTSVEGGPTGAVSVIAFPSLSIKTDGQPQAEQVYLMAHSSDTGECPAGQCESELLYSTLQSTGDDLL